MNISVTWGTVGFGGLITLFVTLIYTGKLLPKPTVDRIVKSYEDRLNAKDEQIELLTKGNDQFMKTNQALLAQHQQALDIGRTTGNVISSLPGAAATAGGGQGVAEVA